MLKTPSKKLLQTTLVVALTLGLSTSASASFLDDFIFPNDTSEPTGSDNVSTPTKPTTPSTPSTQQPKPEPKPEPKPTTPASSKPTTSTTPSNQQPKPKPTSPAPVEVPADYETSHDHDESVHLDEDFPPTTTTPMVPTWMRPTADVPSNHWAKKYIEWGLSNNIVSGYPNGTFRPDAPVSEAEFLAVLVNTFQNIMITKPQESDAHWSNKYYVLASDYDLPMLGFNSLAVRDLPIKRGHVAVLIATLYGKDFNETESIRFLLAHGLSSGKTGPTVEGFGKNDTLTRSEALRFVKQMKDLNIRGLRLS